MKLSLRRIGLVAGREFLAAVMNKGFIIGLLMMPVMPQSTWSLPALAGAGRDPDTVAARLRFTAPFDLSGHPTLTLPGGMTADGGPVGFQIVSRAFEEAGILAAGYAYQQATDWHSRRPPLDA